MPVGKLKNWRSSGVEGGGVEEKSKILTETSFFRYLSLKEL